MSSFFKDIIFQKLNNITLEELKYYSQTYGFSITDAEGEDILHYIQNHPIDPFNAEGRQKIYDDLAQITDKDTALKAKGLFDEIIDSYGLDHLF